MENMTAEILEHIRTHWSETVRFHPESEGTLLGLPHPYTVPCARDVFQELYYWDTYFASRGMALQKEAVQVRNNCDNFIFEIDRYGLVPNGNRTYFLNRSQPPFFGSLVELTLSLFPDDRAWLRHATAALEREMKFWREERRALCGLRHYGSNPDAEALAGFYHVAVERVGYPVEPSSEAERDAAALETLAEAESGWDFTPRFERHCPECGAIDLNSLLFRNGRILGELYRDLGDLEHSEDWHHRAEILQELVNGYCWNEERGVFSDYNFVAKRRNSILSAASIVPLWCGLATQDQAESTLAAVEKYLEFDFGISACERNQGSSRPLQWDYPNGWPPLQFMAIEGFDRYGLTAAAKRIAEKYVECVTRNFRKTGDLWEKYNVFDGTIDVQGEYQMPAMLGWTAGTFVFAATYLAEH